MVDVTTIQSGTVFAWFMLIMLIRRVVLVFLFVIVRSGKPIQPGTQVPEDRKLAGNKIDVESGALGQDRFTKDVRANTVIGNDAENDTYFLIFLLATAAFSDTTSGNGNVIRTILYGAIYLLIRILYAIAYIMALQPWRTIFCFWSVLHTGL
jgi:uncharacterized MAPEG superfamily protein